MLRSAGNAPVVRHLSRYLAEKLRRFAQASEQDRITQAGNPNHTSGVARALADAEPGDFAAADQPAARDGPNDIPNQSTGQSSGREQSQLL